jgi:hypothetical protein
MAFSIVTLMITVLWTVAAGNDGSITTLKLRQTFCTLQESQWWIQHRFSNFLDCTAESFCFDDVSKKLLKVSHFPFL